jgi:hypothetical protein
VYVHSAGFAPLGADPVFSMGVGEARRGRQVRPQLTCPGDE